jgi:hypothetical protein
MKIGPFCAFPLLLALACAPRPAVRSRPSPPPPTPSPEPKKRTSGSDRVFFVIVPQVEDLNGEAVDQPALVPLACVDRGELRGGRGCLGLIPRGQQVLLEGSHRVAVAGRVRPHCEGEVSRAIGLALWSDPKEEVTYALWPADTKTTLQQIRRGAPYEPSNCRGWCSFERTGHPRVRISTEQRRWLADTVARTAPELGAGQARALEVAQLVTLDLDNDDKEDRIYAVSVVDRDADRYAFLFSAIYYVSGGSPDTLILLRRQDSDAIVLRGTLDLDRDGRRELWLMQIPTSGEGLGHAVLTLGREGPEVIGSHICRPQSDSEGE